MALVTDKGFVIKGDKAMIRRLEQLPNRIARRVARQAVSAALTPLNKEAKRQVPRETGQLKRAIGKKIKTYRHNGVIWGAVGVRKGFSKVIDGKRRNPRRYAHLVEARTGFLRRSFDTTRTKVISILGQKLGSGIEREARKL